MRLGKLRKVVLEAISIHGADAEINFQVPNEELQIDALDCEIEDENGELALIIETEN
jgi:hypothetical protein